MHKNTLAIISVALVAGLLAGCEGDRTDESEQAALKDVFKNDFLVGVSLDQATFSGQNARAAEVVKAQFNTVTPENVLKWESVHPEPERYDFSGPDQYVEFGRKNNMVIIGHTLIWHNQTPAWVFEDTQGRPVDRDTLLKRMRDHIHTVVGRYKGRIKGWDVVNEAINDNGSMRSTPWLRIIGEDYIAKAFAFAHEADPAAELYYNDFALENESKLNGVIALVKKLQAQSRITMEWTSLRRNSWMLR
jgi:endo-1,4-beta-xylanase